MEEPRPGSIPMKAPMKDDRITCGRQGRYSDHVSRFLALSSISGSWKTSIFRLRFSSCAKTSAKTNMPMMIGTSGTPPDSWKKPNVSRSWLVIGSRPIMATTMLSAALARPLRTESPITEPITTKAAK